jgi:ABC-2 type transport system ATP-binding protein
MPPAVVIEGVSKTFRQRKAGTRLWRRSFTNKIALAELDLELAPGHVTGVIGLNGSGKSTLVRILATLLLPDTGRARVFGYDVVDQSLEVRRHINRVSVEAAFFKEMSPWENLSYAARLYGGVAERERTVGILVSLGLAADVADRPMKQLSRGQQQKVAIARSFLTTPSLLLMDEPTTGLDPRSKREVQDLLARLRREREVTVVLCTHDLAEAEALCDRVIMLDSGRVLADGTPQQLCLEHGIDGQPVSLEEVFMKLSGRSLEDDREEEGET